MRSYGLTPRQVRPVPKARFGFRTSTSIGHALREFRFLAGWSQQELAYAIGVSRRYIWRLERGQATQQLDRLIDAFWRSARNSSSPRSGPHQEAFKVPMPPVLDRGTSRTGLRSSRPSRNQTCPAVQLCVRAGSLPFRRAASRSVSSPQDWDRFRQGRGGRCDSGASDGRRLSDMRGVSWKSWRTTRVATPLKRRR